MSFQEPDTVPLPTGSSAGSTVAAAGRLPCGGFPPAAGEESDAVHAASGTRGIVSVLAVEEVEKLADWAPAWEELAAAAIEPNVFYEPWQILPAVEAFGKKDVRLIHVLVFSADPASPEKPLLIAYFPLERRRMRRMGMPELTLWKHIHCFLCTPLVRRGYVREALTALLEWARTDARGAAIVRFPQIAGDGLFAKELTGFLQERRRPAFTCGSYERALLVPRADADSYLLEALPTKSRKQIRRLTRRLAEAGEVECASLATEGDLDAWTESFLRLEASGWKGRAETAIASHEPERRFFTKMIREAFRRGRLEMLAMNLNGTPIAMKCNLPAGGGSFSFKIAFDESYSRYSPGMLLEVENIRRFHASPRIQWMDSCAAPNHPMANHLWIDRRTIQAVAVSTGRVMGDSFVRVMPLIQWLARPLVRWRRAGNEGADTGESP